MKVVLFKKSDSLISKIISYFTKSDYTHAAIMLTDYCLIDSSETRGHVDIKSFLEYNDRECVIYDLHRLKNIDNYLVSCVGLPYDWEGVFGWLIQANDKKRFYCFEFVRNAILMARNVKLTEETHLSGDSIIELLDNYGAKLLYSGKLANYKYN